MRSLLLVVWYSALWAGFGIVSGWIGARIPDRWLEVDRGPLRLRGFEFRGRWYDRRLRLRVWKDRLPEAGALFNGGLSKSRLPGFDRSNLLAFAAATRRAEYVHWSNVAFGFTFALWNDWVVGVVMALFGIVVHLPFVLVQRYNRARLEYVLLRPVAVR